MFDVPGVFVGHDGGFGVLEDVVEEVGDVGFSVFLGGFLVGGMVEGGVEGFLFLGKGGRLGWVERAEMGVEGVEGQKG